MSIRVVVSLSSLLLGVSVALAAPRASVPSIPFERYVLPNGMQVILHVDKKLPLAHVNLWYHVGSKDEQPGRTGFAHLFEHIMLQGSKNAHEDYFSLMARAGAKGGRDSNGTTSNDRTNYYATAPSGNVEYLLWVHADLLATLPDALTQTKLDNQRDVVRNERRQGIDNAPYGRWHSLLAKSLFPAGHPYSWPIIGSHEDLQAASLEDVKSFFRTYYTPNNLSLVVAGDFEPAEAKRMIEKHFGTIAPGPALDRPRRDLPQLNGEKVVEVRERVSQERVFLAWLIPEMGAAGAPELELTADILTDGLSARLQRKLVYDRKLCTRVNGYADSMEIAGVFVVDATLRPGASMAEVEKLITTEIGALAKTGPSAAELERVRTRSLTRTTSSLQNIGASGKADLLNYSNVFFGDPAKFTWHLERLLAVTPQSVRAATAQWLATPNRVVLRFLADSSLRSGVAEPDRSKAPALGADVPFRVPAVARGKLSNGLELYVVERHELPLVSATAVSRAGSVLDPSGKEGLAVLAAQAMSRGTKQRSALSIAETLGDLGTSLSTYTTFERSSHELEVQKANLAPALAVLADVVRNPAFPQMELERERKLQLDGIEQVERDAPQLARRLRGLFAFGIEHPYGRPSTGYRSSVASLTAADVSSFHAAAWRPESSALVFVGDVTLAEATALAEKSFGGWTGAATMHATITPAAPPAPGKIVIVDKPDAAQTVIVQLYSAPQAKGADYYAFRLASEVLGTTSSGRLYLNLRQDKGYTYVVGAATQTLSSGMSWLAQGAVATDKTKESVIEFVKELRGIARERPISAGELESARLAIVRNYAAAFGTCLEVAGRIVELWSRRWPLEELALEPDNLRRATLAEVQAAAQRYARPADSTLLLVGDRHKIESAVRALGVGEVSVVDVEGRPLVPNARGASVSVSRP